MTESTRGILTDADREFLEKDHSERVEEYSRSAISQRKSTIRQRVYHGLNDLEFLFHALPDRDRRRVFESFEEGFILHKRSALLRCGVAFLLLGVAEEENVDLDEEQYYEDLFYRVIESILHKVGLGAERIDVEVTIEGWNHPNEGLAAGDLSELSEEQLRFLLFDGQISSEQFARAVLESSGDDSSEA
jgi:hypothetical protein